MISFRDVALTLTIVAMLPFCLVRPWVGLLAWAWVAFMNPHRLTWGFAYDLPVAMMIAVCTIVGYPFARDRKPFILTRETLLMLVLWGWFTLTTLFAMYPEAAWAKWQETSKTLLMACLSITLFQDRRKFRILLLVIAGSIGFYGFKGGIFALLTGGQWMVLGPPGTFFEANTEVALVLNMSLPLTFYLAKEEERRWLRNLLRAAFALTIVAVPFTYSRGGVVGLAIVLSVLFIRDRARLMLIPLALAGLVAFSMFAPQQFFDRLGTLRNYEEDASANLRFMTWRMGYEIAKDRPIFGGGFQVFRFRSTYDMYLPEYPSIAHDAHSIYFNLLGEHGWFGLALFLGLVMSTLASLERLRRLGGRNAELVWASNYARMLQASLLAWLATGAFLSVAYFDLGYQLFFLTIILKGIVSEQTATSAAEQVPARVLVPARRVDRTLS